MGDRTMNLFEEQNYDFSKALHNLRPGAVWSHSNNSYETLQWDPSNQSQPPSKEEVEAEMARPAVRFATLTCLVTPP